MIATWSCAPPRTPTPSSPGNGPCGAPDSIAATYSANASGLPACSANAAFVASNQRFVSGHVRVKLFKGKATVVGRKSDLSLYSKKLATYETGDQFDHEAAQGFIRLWGLSQQTQARQQLLKGGKGFELPGLSSK